MRSCTSSRGKAGRRGRPGLRPWTPPRGSAPWIPAKGEPLELFTWLDGGGNGGREPAVPPPSSQTDGLQRLRLCWGSRGQSPLVGFRTKPWLFLPPGRPCAAGGGCASCSHPAGASEGQEWFDGRRSRRKTHHDPCAGGFRRDARGGPPRRRDAGHDRRRMSAPASPRARWTSCATSSSPRTARCRRR